MEYHYQFAYQYTKFHPVEAVFIGRFVLDMREVVTFSEVEDYITKSDERRHRSVTNVDIRGGDSVTVLMAYKDFKKLYESVMKVKIISMPESESNLCESEHS